MRYTLKLYNPDGDCIVHEFLEYQVVEMEFLPEDIEALVYTMSEAAEHDISGFEPMITRPNTVVHTVDPSDRLTQIQEPNDEHSPR